MDTIMTGDENWTLENGRLTIHENAMEQDWELAPWKSCRDDIREAVLEGGIFSIPRDAFRDCRNLRSVRFPESVWEIGRIRLRRLRELDNRSLPGSRAGDGPRHIQRNKFETK